VCEVVLPGVNELGNGKETDDPRLLPWLERNTEPVLVGPSERYFCELC
jgi:hypothetical protein